MPTFWKSQFDKLLMAFLIVLFCGLAVWASGIKETSAFALQSAAGCLGCLITLVTARKAATPETFAEPTSSSTSTTTTSQSETKPQEPPKEQPHAG